jgi:NAD(P)-dependent dehydrogenase (short-subunit alcohol dehydrogenase family)
MAVVKEKVPTGRFAGRRILVVGGSRGLGEVAAKILAAGGAEVALTYRLGQDDADKIVADIQKHGGTATCFQLDTASRSWEKGLSVHGPGFDHLCYFATPPIAGGDGQTFNQPLYEKFAAVYVSGLFDIAQWIAGRTNGRFALFNASSAAVEAPPPRLLEYAAAKAASEACCRWLAGAYPQARIYIARFPRLPTDQLSFDPALSGIDTLEPVLAELSRWLPA